jgi:hypothetical protein
MELGDAKILNSVIIRFLRRNKMAKKVKKKVSKKAATPNLDIQIRVDKEATGLAINLAISAMIMDRTAFKDTVKEILTNEEDIASVWEALDAIYDRTDNFNKQIKEAMKFMRQNRAKANVEVKALKNLKIGKVD